MVCLSTPTFSGTQHGPEDGLKKGEGRQANVLDEDSNVRLFSPNDIT